MSDYYEMESYFRQCPGTGTLVLDMDGGLVEELRKLPSTLSEVRTDQPLDLHAHIAYEDERYWWVIALYNDIIDPDRVDVPRVLIPPKSSVDTLLTRYYRKS